MQAGTFCSVKEISGVATLKTAVDAGAQQTGIAATVIVIIVVVAVILLALCSCCLAYFCKVCALVYKFCRKLVLVSCSRLIALPMQYVCLSLCNTWRHNVFPQFLNTCMWWSLRVQLIRSARKIVRSLYDICLHFLISPSDDSLFSDQPMRLIRFFSLSGQLLLAQT